MNIETKEGFAGHPAKLRDGGWGAHVNSDAVLPGDAVHLTTKAGREWDSTVEKVVWTGNDSDGNPCALCTLVGKDKRAGDGKPASKAAAPKPAPAEAEGADF